jgi:hypothetical protein
MAARASRDINEPEPLSPNGVPQLPESANQHKWRRRHDNSLDQQLDTL